MEPLTDLDLFALAIGALDPGRERALGERIAASPDEGARLDEVAREVAAWRASPGAPPRPSGVVPSVSASVQHAPLLGRHLRPGELFYVMLRGVADATDRFLIVLRAAEEGWRWIYPTQPDELHPADRLPLDGDARRLGLSADEDLGRQRWVVALPPLWMAPDWALPAPERWTALLAGVEARAFPVVDLEVEVSR